MTPIQSQKMKKSLKISCNYVWCKTWICAICGLRCAKHGFTIWATICSLLPQTENSSDSSFEQRNPWITYIHDLCLTVIASETSSSSEISTFVSMYNYCILHVGLLVPRGVPNVKWPQRTHVTGSLKFKGQVKK